ncbi:MAG: hypothetical protein RLZZ596_2217 [Pseudomonadota bacterium]|jgi:uncharacterized protein YgbK (DUF1537 family)
MSNWRILSDNLLGAVEAASAWAGTTEIPVLLDPALESGQAVQAMVSHTRDASPAEMQHRLLAALDWFTGGGCKFKKIDSLLRGNTIAEIAWLMASGRFAGAVFAPGFPGQGRFTAQGRHWVASANQPYGPRSHEHGTPLDQVLRREGLVARMTSQIDDCLSQPGQVVIPDLLTDEDLGRLAALSEKDQASQWLWCGGAGLAGALAGMQAGKQTDRASHQTAPSPCGTGRPILLTASRHPLLRDQLHQLALLKLPLSQLDLSDIMSLPREQAQELMVKRLQALVAHHERPAVLVIVGGYTLLALCRATRARSLMTSPSPQTGWGQTRMVGGHWNGVCCFVHSSTFALNDDLCGFLTKLCSAQQRETLAPS